MPERQVPIWVRDEQWDVWHCWPLEERMTRFGEARTACGEHWRWSKTVLTSYHVLSKVACYLCVLALEGTPARGRGRPRELPVGPVVEPKPLAGMGHIRREQRAVASRTERLLAAGARQITYTRPDGKVVTAAHPDRVMRLKLAAEDAEVEAFEGSFEVGRRLAGWPCPECGVTLVTGAVYCSSWCTRLATQGEQEERLERDGRAMARRQFEDMLYGRKRRDTFRLWTPERRGRGAWWTT